MIFPNSHCLPASEVELAGVAQSGDSMRAGQEDAEAPLLDAPQDPEPRKQRSTLLTVCPFILGNEFCERLAFYGLSTNLVIYLTTVMGARPANAATNLMLFEGTCYLTPILGAWLADSLWGRYRTILVFSGIYFVGMFMLAITAWVPGLTPGPEDTASVLQNGLLYGALYIVALGTGGIKPNVSAFGADQFDESDPQDRKEKKSFFNWFYLAINVGSLLAVSVVVYIQESVGWAIGFAIPAVCMLLAILTFVSGSGKYTHVEPTESPMTRVVKVLSAATKARWSGRKRRKTPQSGYTGPVNLPPDALPGIRAAMKKNNSYAWLDGACADEADNGGAAAPGGVGGFSASQVEEVRMVLRLMPIFFTTILFWTIYVQMGSFFVEQGAAMDRDLPGGRFRIPAASLAIFNTVSIIVLIPIYDRGLVPLLRHFGKKLTQLQRIGWGLLVCVMAMVTAAGVEFYRLRLFHEGKVMPESYTAASLVGRHLGERQPAVVQMSVFWQIPQYLLIGLSEVLASIGQLEFFYDQAPDVMRSCSMALQLLSVAIGSYLSGAVVWGVGYVTSLNGHHGWLGDDLNHGRLDLFFLFLAALMLLNMLVFGWVAMRYTYKKVEHVTARHPPAHMRRPVPQWMQPQLAHTAEITIHGSRIPPIEDVGVYGRSVTYAPDSPALPAPFR
ncbi:hypothetical protein WJX72_010466 [[Myrmecia] bisecta]|uniref:Uncharacterized protein n=1 Tax=[Myrmecia] bisecta TaxID=41462 RepID=A0AAW1PDE0_9CHLO